MPKEYDVIVVGELNVDLILNQIDSFPEIGKEKLADKMDLVLGSSSAIFASNLSSLGAKVGYIGKIGNDIFGNLIIESLKKKKVNTELIIVDEKLKTGATVVLNFDEDRAMITHGGAMEHLVLNDINKDILAKAKHLHVSSVFLQPQLKKNIVEIFRLAKEIGITTSFDPQWDPNEKWDLDLIKLLPLVDVFVPNEEEIKNLTKEESVEKAIESLSNFANTIVVKRGRKGSISWYNNKLNEMSAFLNKDVVDAIGAGDSFDAGYILKFIKGKSTEVCQNFANLIGAINTTAAGGTAAFNSYSDIMKKAKTVFGYSE